MNVLVAYCLGLEAWSLSLGLGCPSLTTSLDALKITYLILQ